jgi:RNA polymerase sigma-70 factor (ECF subfamily)
MTALSKRATARPAPGAETEAGLLDQARRGDEAAIRQLVRQLNPRLFRVARGIVASDAEAEEVVQETYLVAFTRLAEFEGRARFATWITRIAINNARMQRRRARPPQEDYDTVTETEDTRIVPFPGQHAEWPETSADRTRTRGLLEAAVAELPPELRLPFLMHEVEGLAIAEVAHDIGLNPITVRTRLFRARRRLRRILETRIGGGFDKLFPFDGERCTRMADRVIAGLRERRT